MNITEFAMFKKMLGKGGGGGSADNGMTGVWVFNDVLTIPPEEIRNKSCYFGFAAKRPYDFVHQMNEFVVMCDNILYLSYYNDDVNIDDVYDGEFGWSNEMFKTIIITEPPTDEAFIAWLKANATLSTNGGWRESYETIVVSVLDQDYCGPYTIEYKDKYGDSLTEIVPSGGTIEITAAIGTRLSIISGGSFSTVSIDDENHQHFSDYDFSTKSIQLPYYGEKCYAYIMG